jgi:myo-inositol-1(or 4)-monophosphatase
MGNLAMKAAEAGGAVISAAPREGVPAAQLKGAGDYVTDIDRASEAAISAVLAAETPDIPIRAEEGGGETGPRYWVVDPLDGTTNFMHGFPVVAVSVALVEADIPVAGCVHAPFLEETYVAELGMGAWRKRHGGGPVRLSVSDRLPGESIVGTGFPFRNQALHDRYISAMVAALSRFEDLRRPGAAAMDLAWVAAGVFDGFFELGLSPWDVAAGGLLIKEAGGVVTDWNGGQDWLSGDILAGSEDVHSALLQIARATR